MNSLNIMCLNNPIIAKKTLFNAIKQKNKQ